MSIWDTLRLVALDLETCRAPDLSERIVSFGLVVTDGTNRPSAWTEWVNPGVPIDEMSAGIHGITDEAVRNRPAFREFIPDILRRLTAGEHEVLALVAHNTAFDIRILRNEFLRAEAELPDLPILDTMTGLRAAGGITTGSASLVALLGDLDLPPLTDHHDALADARACADAAVCLVERSGYTEPDELLAAAGAAQLLTITGRPVREQRSVPEVDPLPPDHHAAHDDIGDVAALLDDCARLRCERITEVGRERPPSEVRRHLFELLRRPAAAGDAAAAATVTGALIELFDQLPAGIAGLRAEVHDLPKTRGGRSASRALAYALASWMDGVLESVSRCPPDDYCPWCAQGLPCPRDAFHDAIASRALVSNPDHLTRDVVDSFWKPESHGNTKRGYAIMRGHSVGLADATLRHVLDYWELIEPATGEAVIQSLWAEGYHSPLLAERRARRTAGGGRHADLLAAEAICEELLTKRDGNTALVWHRLAVLDRQIEAALREREEPEKRRHHPSNPKRPPRKPRFLRSLPVENTASR